MAHLPEDCGNRLSPETFDITKRYVEGRLSFYLKLRSRRGSCDLHIILRRNKRERDFGNVKRHVDVRCLSCLVVKPWNCAVELPICDPHEHSAAIIPQDHAWLFGGNFLHEVTVCR